MKIRFVVFTFLLINNLTTSLAQGYNNLWLVGYENYNPLPMGGTNIDFFTGTANAYYEPNRSMEFRASVLNICDSVGNLLFYSNGAWIANKLNTQMLNGDSLNPSYYTSTHFDGLNLVNSIFSLKLPDSDSLFYLFHQTIDINGPPWTLNCYLSIINMNLDNGNGAVIQKNQILLSDTLAIQMAACKHANGRDWWIILPEAYHPSYYVYLFTPNGIQFSSKQTIGNRYVFKAGQATFSRDGSLYAIYDSVNDLDVFDFDRCSGTFSNARHVAVNDSMNSSGVTISPNNRFVYGSSGLYLYQFDLQNLQNYHTFTWDSFRDPISNLSTIFYTQELMPDNKIYINTGNSTRYLHVINNPDSLGAACQLAQHSFVLPTINFQSTPYYPNVFLGPVVGSICDSLSVGLPHTIVQSAGLRLNPNPATNQVWVNYQFPNNRDGWLEIYDPLGKLILKRRLYWSTTQLLVYLNEIKSSGIYVAKVFDDTGMYLSTEKMVVNK
jgi:hypothetical protein